MGSFRIRRGAVSLVFGLGLFSLAASAQNVPYVRAGSFEVGPFVGASYGLVNAQYMVGGNVTFAVNKFVLPYFEYTYLPKVAAPAPSSLLNFALPPGATFTSQENISFSDFHGGVHLRFPIREKPIVPYLAFGVGGLDHFSASGTVTVRNPDGTQFSGIGFKEAGAVDFAVNAGGGLRYYINQRWGLRVEAKVYKPTGTYTSPFGKVEFGLFYQFR
jgi:hypothetical protein